MISPIDEELGAEIRGSLLQNPYGLIQITASSLPIARIALMMAVGM
jgi:hypothetical protein